MSDVLRQLQEGLDLLDAALDDIDWRIDTGVETFGERFTPKGAGEALPKEPDEIDAEATIEADIRRWESKRPDEKGLLEAE